MCTLAGDLMSEIYNCIRKHICLITQSSTYNCQFSSLLDVKKVFEYCSACTMHMKIQNILGQSCDIQTKISVEQTQPAQRGHVRGTAVEGTCNQGMRNCQMLKTGSPDQNKSSGCFSRVYSHITLYSCKSFHFINKLKVN